MLTATTPESSRKHLGRLLARFIQLTLTFNKSISLANAQRNAANRLTQFGQLNCFEAPMDAVMRIDMRGRLQCLSSYYSKQFIWDRLEKLQNGFTSCQPSNPEVHNHVMRTALVKHKNNRREPELLFQLNNEDRLQLSIIAIAID